MSTVMSDLWPDDIQAEDVISPEEILEHQAERLEARTNGLLAAHVVRLEGDDRVVINFEVESVRTGSRVRLFAVQHRLEFEYPVAIVPPQDSLPDYLRERFYRPGLGEAFGSFATVSKLMGPGAWVENEWVASSPTEFTKLVHGILALPSVKGVVLSLLARSSRERAPAEKDENAS